MWVQDGNPKYLFLLKFALSEKNFQNTLIMFVVSMKTPWNIMDQLESWATLLQDYVDNLPIPSENLLDNRQKCKQGFVLQIKHYVFNKCFATNKCYFIKCYVKLLDFPLH